MMTTEARPKWDPRAKRKPRDPEKFNTAIKGKVFCSRPDLQPRWGVGPGTVKKRLAEAISLGFVAPVVFSASTIRYKLDEIEKYEEFKRVRGLETLMKQKAEKEARKAAKAAQ